MAYYLGLDTSNYTSSVALYNSQTRQVIQQKKLLPVKQGTLGLRQSDAVFAHVKQLGALVRELMAQESVRLDGVGVSVRPRDQEGSYMPCFLGGRAGSRVDCFGLRNTDFQVFSPGRAHCCCAFFRGTAWSPGSKIRGIPPIGWDD